MPGKGRRVASRQAQLGRRRKRQARGPGEAVDAPVGVAPAEMEAEGGLPAAPVRAPRPVAPPSRGRPAAGVANRTFGDGSSRRSARSRADHSLVYAYIGREVRRIGALSGAMLAILIVLAILL